MKKGIKADLYLPRECFEKIVNGEEDFKDYMDTYFGMCNYEIYLGEYDNKEVCGVEIEFLNKTCACVNADYKHFKAYLKELTGKQPKQILMFKFDRI